MKLRLSGLGGRMTGLIVSTVVGGSPDVTFVVTELISLILHQLVWMP